MLLAPLRQPKSLGVMSDSKEAQSVLNLSRDLHHDAKGSMSRSDRDQLLLTRSPKDAQSRANTEKSTMEIHPFFKRRDSTLSKALVPTSLKQVPVPTDTRRDRQAEIHLEDQSLHDTTRHMLGIDKKQLLLAPLPKSARETTTIEVQDTDGRSPAQNVRSPCGPRDTESNPIVSTTVAQNLDLSKSARTRLGITTDNAPVHPFFQKRQLKARQQPPQDITENNDGPKFLIQLKVSSEALRRLETSSASLGSIQEGAKGNSQDSKESYMVHLKVPSDRLKSIKRRVHPFFLKKGGIKDKEMLSSPGTLSTCDGKSYDIFFKPPNHTDDRRATGSC
jgi:hypothetical protein